MNTHHQQPWKYCYWLDHNHFLNLQEELKETGIETTCAQYAPCEALKGDIGYAEPHVWPVLCKSDATPWYDESTLYGKTLVVSSFPLHERYDPFLQTTITPSAFQTPYMPILKEKEKLCENSVYLSKKPKAWSQFPEEWSEEMVKGFAEMSGNPSITFEDILLRWNAVHANFINPAYRAGEPYLNAPYSIDESKYISTCCVELFNLLDSDEKALLVRPCIGAVIADVLTDNQYYQVDIRRSGI
ncbi:MAG: hypothetical protein JW902_08700 [Syntrophaceae bacterium]|nr:hypothetical protein [Syntrophaceae bacterium]